MEHLRNVVETHKIKCDWSVLNEGERLIVENSIMLVSIMSQMCKVQLVKKSQEDEEQNEINQEAIQLSLVRS